jgi:hypothetical protein
MSEAHQKPNPQQWELIASPGHILLAQVDAYRLKTKAPMILAAVAAATVYLAFFVAPLVGSASGSVVGWITGAASSIATKKPIDPTPAPAVKELRPVFSASMRVDPAVVPSLEVDVAPEMLAQVKGMQAGTKNEGCDYTKRITDLWSDGVDMTPKCRYSADGSRLWVWALVKSNEQLRPFIGLIAKKDGQVTYYNVQAQGAAGLAGNPSIAPSRIPRAVAADFPELMIGAQK